MSRIGRKPIELPSGVMVALSPGRVQVNGPLGELSQVVPARMQIEKRDEEVVVTRPTERGEDRALHGLTRTLIANMVEGVTKGFEKHLEIQGVGYRAQLKGTDLELAVGFSHPVTIKPRANLLRRAGADPDHRQGHRQAGRRADRRRDPQGPAARAVQGQGHPLPRRAGPQEGREARVSVMTKRQARMRRHRRVRSKIAGTAERPRLAVFRSNRGIFAQLVDDSSGRTLAAAGWNSSLSSSGSRPSRRAPSARPSARRRRRPVSSAACSIAAATCTTDASRRSQRARARKD